VAAVVSTRWIVGLLVSGPAGVISDRYDRRRVVQAGALVSAAVAAVLAALVAVDAPIPTLLVCAALLSVSSSVNRPASDALVPEVVSERDLSAANALIATLQNLVVVLGPALGGALLLTGEPATGIAVNAASFVASAALFSLVGARARGDAKPGAGMGRQLVEGWQILVRHRTAFTLVLLLVLDSAVFGAASVFYGPVSEHVGTGANGYSYLIACQALGGVVGAALGDRLAGRARLAPVLIGGFAVECVPLAFVTATRSVLVVALLQVLFGVGMVIIDVLGMTALQRDIPRQALGRANALMMGMVSAATAGASLLATVLLSAAGLTATVIAVGVGFPLLALLGIPTVRRNERQAEADLARLADAVDLLQTLDLFTGASRATLEQLARAAQPMAVDAGTVLIRQGDPADALFVLQRGTLAVEIIEDEGSRARPDIAAPAYVGEIGLLRRIPRTATVRAATACELWRIGAADFGAALDTAAASRSLVTLAAERFSRTDYPVSAAPQP
jgi:CRP-like cAMP-binding protein/predicted MFS family arabinose efflux permease